MQKIKITFDYEGSSAACKALMEHININLRHIVRDVHYGAISSFGIESKAGNNVLHRIGHPVDNTKIAETVTVLTLGEDSIVFSDMVVIAATDVESIKAAGAAMLLKQGITTELYNYGFMLSTVGKKINHKIFVTERTIQC